MKSASITKCLLFIVPLAFVVLCDSGLCISSENSSANCLSVSGALNKPLIISTTDLKAFSPFHINNVSLLKERGDTQGSEEIIGVFNYKGVLLRDILEKAGMKYKRKWEPLVLIRVKGVKGEEVTFSFGEVFYSSIGRSILVAYEKNGLPLKFIDGCGQLAVTTDVRCGRTIDGMKEIIVERVDIHLKAYDDKKNKVVRPATQQLLLVDRRNSVSRFITLKDMEGLPMVFIKQAVMTGDCEGFVGVYAFEGPSLRSLLEKFLKKGFQKGYDRYVVISSEDGFSAAFSFGELFNSRLENNIIIAIKKNDEILGAKDGFAMSVVGEDSTGGRSVKRIQRIELY